jgi:hypothetical protein
LLNQFSIFKFISFISSIATKRFDAAVNNSSLGINTTHNSIFNLQIKFELEDQSNLLPMLPTHARNSSGTDCRKIRARVVCVHDDQLSKAFEASDAGRLDIYLRPAPSEHAYSQIESSANAQFAALAPTPRASWCG